MSYPLDSTSAAGLAVLPEEIRAPSLHDPLGWRANLGTSCNDVLASLAALAQTRGFDRLEVGGTEHICLKYGQKLVKISS